MFEGVDAVVLDRLYAPAHVGMMLGGDEVIDRALEKIIRRVRTKDAPRSRIRVLDNRVLRDQNGVWMAADELVPRVELMLKFGVGDGTRGRRVVGVHLASGQVGEVVQPLLCTGSH